MSRSSTISPLRPQLLPEDLAEALARAGDRLGPFGLRPLWYDEVGSTNDVAAALGLAGGRHGTVVVAGRQHAGRGRQGRAWLSPAGTGLYVSVVLRFGGLAPPLLTLAAGVALAEGVQAASGLSPTLKWPNDLLVGERKLAGVLTESCLVPNGVAPVIVLGFGINLRVAAHPPEVLAVATSVEEELGRDVDRGLLLAECLAALKTRVERLKRGDASGVLEAWRARAELDRSVEWTDTGGTHRGVAVDVAEDGALMVRTADGVVRLSVGEVRWTR